MCFSPPGPMPLLSIQVGRPGCQAAECWLQTPGLLILQPSLGGPAWDLVLWAWGLCLGAHRWAQGRTP